MTGGLLPPVNDRRNSEKIISEWLVIRPKYGSWNFFRALVVYFSSRIGLSWKWGLGASVISLMAFVETGYAREIFRNFVEEEKKEGEHRA